MTTTDPGADLFTGDRYERLTQATEILASDPNVMAAEFPYNSEGLRAFVGTITEGKLLDGLTEDDANTAAMLAIIDFTVGGPERIAKRIAHLLAGEPVPGRDVDDHIAVVHRLVGILNILLAAFMVAEDEIDGRPAK
jgi:hypothetical protein